MDISENLMVHISSCKFSTHNFSLNFSFDKQITERTELTESNEIFITLSITRNLKNEAFNRNIPLLNFFNTNKIYINIKCKNNRIFSINFC